MKICTVTITGADDSIDPQDLVQLSKKYPFVEWGILLSMNSQGSPRFPSRDWMQRLLDRSDELRLSGHLCGKWVRDLVAGEPSYQQANPHLWPMFKRIQLNFHGNTEGFCPRFLDAIHLAHDKQFIFQLPNFENELFTKCREANLNVVPLFDLSHGQGVTPETWPEPLAGVCCGFAGGLGPDNIEHELEKIQSSAINAEVWIDMETKVRSDDNARFDLYKVERCLDIAEDYVTPDSWGKAYLQTGAAKKKIQDSLPPPPKG